MFMYIIHGHVNLNFSNFFSVSHSENNSHRHSFTIGRLHVTSRISRQKKWMTKSSNLCWRGIGRTPTFGVILKTNEKLIKIWNELLLVGFSERNKFDQKQFG